ncbi:MAG: type I restriction enzyme HsdR N-terminal domain-containing protein [Bacteroidia bacterium]|nr:type I restriction enzyme HsdR N-terminal domain-containing protein [Bacteroidia bacterium]
MQRLNFQQYQFSIENRLQKKVIFDNIRKKFVPLTPEEWVRQHVVSFLTVEKHFPAGLLSLERQLILNGLNKRTDIVAYNKLAEPVLIVECKAPEVPVTKKVFEQIARYNLKLKVPFLMVSNGINHYYCFADWKNNKINFIESLPPFNEIENTVVVEN